MAICIPAKSVNTHVVISLFITLHSDVIMIKSNLKLVNDIYITVTGIEEENIEICGGVKRLYVDTAVCMSDVSEKEKQEIIVINRTQGRPTSVDYLKEIEDDEDRKSGDDDAGASGMANDTYYNIAGQRVAVARLAEYIKNKSQEDLFNDFEVSAFVCSKSCRANSDRMF